MDLTIKEEKFIKNRFGFTEIKGIVSLEEQNNVVYSYAFLVMEDTARNIIKIFSNNGSVLGELYYNSNIYEKKKEIKGKNKEVISTLLDELFNEYFEE